jgi:hypothetical protein
MKTIAKAIMTILLATIWISICEFSRNQLWLKSYWTEHYQNMGLIFPAEPVNGMIWGIWALVFSVFIFVLAKKHTLLQTAVLAWVAGFVFMWLVIGNLGVLPFRILYYAVPLSIVEVLVAVWIIVKLSGSKAKNKLLNGENHL